MLFWRQSHQSDSFIHWFTHSPLLHSTVIKHLRVPVLRIQWWLGHIHSCPYGVFMLWRQKEKQIINSWPQVASNAVEKKKSEQGRLGPRPGGRRAARRRLGTRAPIPHLPGRRDAAEAEVDRGDLLLLFLMLLLMAKKRLRVSSPLLEETPPPPRTAVNFQFTSKEKESLVIEWKTVLISHLGKRCTFILIIFAFVVVWSSSGIVVPLAGWGKRIFWLKTREWFF